MKYLIYLSVILFVLSGCKGNAFMKQRYTNFSSVQHKKENKPALVKSKVQHEQAIATVSLNDETANANSYQVPSEQIAMSPVFIENVVSPRTPMAHKNSITEKKGIQKYTSQVGQHFNKINQNEKKRGVIGLILEIVLSIIILAIVVAVVILVVLV